MSNWTTYTSSSACMGKNKGKSKVTHNYVMIIKFGKYIVLGLYIFIKDNHNLMSTDRILY